MLGVNNGNSTITLTGALTSNGAPVSIISSGNITANSGSINTSGGTVNVISGVAFTPTQSSSTFSLTSGSTSGGCHKSR